MSKTSKLEIGQLCWLLADGVLIYRVRVSAATDYLIGEVNEFTLYRVDGVAGYASNNDCHRSNLFAFPEETTKMREKLHQLDARIESYLGNKRLCPGYDQAEAFAQNLGLV